ncbi:PilX N-terminal domain-containing pilus assembly protein [Halopseudomonas sp.]|jgi:type IV pilus assembly protein PilX|uniref:pilus assembly PilX family protein n=1 Tax=Halopseudomonas sp. TaxID=2901191 RepID=UPI0039E4D55C
MNIHPYRSRTPAHRAQSGAALVLSLVFLLILTTLAVTNMREVALESRTTGNLVNQKGCFNASEAGLRDGEYRISGKLTDATPGNYPSIPVASYGGSLVLAPPNASETCPAGLPADQPCVLDQEPTFDQAFAAGEPGFAGVKQYAPDESTVFEQDILWYAVPFIGGASLGESENPEYGNYQAGIGPSRHEINATSSDESCRVDLRSTTLRVYL